MVVVGGVSVRTDALDDFTALGGSPDPWEQGLGIFDLTQLAWKSSYDANAAPYTTPSAVKAANAKNGKYPAEWSSPIIESWFTTSRKLGKRWPGVPRLC
jgi:hypothetical protein